MLWTRPARRHPFTRLHATLAHTAICPKRIGSRQMAKQRHVGKQQRSAHERPINPRPHAPDAVPYRVGKRMRSRAQPMGAPKLKPPCGTPAAAASGTCCPKRYVPCIARHVKALLMDSVMINCPLSFEAVPELQPQLLYNNATERHICIEH